MPRQVHLSLTIIAAALLGACATPSPMPTGVVAGRFVTFTCESAKTFQARWTEDGKSVRVRAHHGSAELSSAGDGVFEGEGYRLVTRGEGAVSLSHGGKPQAVKCRVQ
jgi:hypothetical protein